MKDNLTEVVFIIDMSGSMGPYTSDTIGGYNKLLEDQKNNPGDAVITTVFFNTAFTKVHDRVDIKNVKPITDKEYRPAGCTAMLDAVGKTIDDIGKKLADMKEEDRPSSVIVTIITDGYENASTDYSWAQIQNMIKEQREKYNWIFTFIGANIDVMDVSNSLGIDSRLAKAYTSSSKGTDSVYTAMSAAVSSTRENYAKAKNAKARDAVLDSISDIMDESIE